MVDHQGDPVQGMPEAGVGGRQGPPRRCRRQSGQHLCFFRSHIDMVVEKDEIEGGQAPEHRKDGQGQPQKDQALQDEGTFEIAFWENANFQDLTPLYDQERISRILRKALRHGRASVGNLCSPFS